MPELTPPAGERDVVAVVPMRHNSERVKGKNFRELGGMPLYHHIVRTLLEVDAVSSVVIDTDSEWIAEDTSRTFPDVVVMERPEHLRAGETPMNEVLLNTVRHIGDRTILQTHSTNPFLSATTIAGAIDTFFDDDDETDSVFGVTRLQARLWTPTGEPVNHDPQVLLRTQDLPPIYVENSCFYLFGSSTLESSRNRLGKSPRMVEVPAREALDIDDESDFELAVAVASLRAGGPA